MFPDLRIERKKCVQLKRPGDKAVADRGHKDESFFAQENIGSSHHKGRENMISRHANVNSRVKYFDSFQAHLVMEFKNIIFFLRCCEYIADCNRNM